MYHAIDCIDRSHTYGTLQVLWVTRDGSPDDGVGWPAETFYEQLRSAGFRCDDVTATPLPDVLALAREAGCLDDPAEELRPTKRRRQDNDLLVTQPVPFLMCPRHPTHKLYAVNCVKPGPNYGRTFCARCP